MQKSFTGRSCRTVVHEGVHQSYVKLEKYGSNLLKQLEDIYLLAVKTRKNEDKLATQTNCYLIITEQAS